jgi:hypothetical protein
MPYERIAHYRHDAERLASPSGSTMIDGLEVVDDQPVVLAPLETMEPTDPRRGRARAPRPDWERRSAPRSRYGMG